MDIERLFYFYFLFSIVRCHCPHLAKMNKPEGPAQPSHLPPGDKGWDWDETAAPGSVPEEHFIQTSLVQKAITGEEKDFATKLEEGLKRLQERLRREARVTIDNENIDCGSSGDHYRCGDFPPIGSYHFLVVEDSSSGAAVYSVDRKYNSRSTGAIEMAILDALSRHSPSPLTVYASKEAEKEIGFVRRLSAKELQSLSAKPAEPLPRRSPIEMNLFEPKVLELRTTSGLEEVPGSRLKTFSSQEEFDDALKNHPELVVFFWNHNDPVSVHVFQIWARLSVTFDQKEALLAEVQCHKHASFCTGLGPRDFRTIVAYRESINVASTDLLGDEEYYKRWIRLVLKGPVVELQDEEELVAAKRGHLLGTDFPAVTVATFGDDASVSFKHYKIAAERVLGRYALAYRIKKGAANSISTYKPNEKMKRLDYDGRFDPSSLISFITRSSEPSVIDISNGFSTEALFYQPRGILLFEGVTDEVFEKVYSEELRMAAIVAKQNSEVKMTDVLKLGSKNESLVVFFDKDKVSWSPLDTSSKTEDILKLIREGEVKTLTRKEVHPLRLLQVLAADHSFGTQKIILLPDHTLFQEIIQDHPKISDHVGGGCPFMSEGGAAQNHDEL